MHAHRENRRRGIVWIFVSFGALVIGLVGGTILFAWKSPWAGVFPLAAFAGYVLAFRRGLQLWSPDLDRSWRNYVCFERGSVEDEEAASSPAGEDPEKTLRIVPGDTLRPPRPELKVIR
jgi:MFS family permease